MTAEGEGAKALPCPFCGGEAKAYGTGISCPNLACEFVGLTNLEAWNRRTPDPATQRVLEAAKEWRKHKVCCPPDCPDRRNAETELSLALDAVEDLAGREK